MATDVLFIHPGDHRKTYQELSSEFTAIAPPEWTALLAHYLRKEGFSVAVHDVNVQGWDEETARRLLSEADPGLAVLMVYGHHPSASTQTMPAAGMIAGHLKELNPDLPLAMGGLHPSALPERTLMEERVDYVIQGEGPSTLAGLVNFLKGRLPMRRVPGLWYREGGRPRFTFPAALIEQLDTVLDGHAWDLLPGLEQYRAHNMHCFQDFEKSECPDFADVRSPYAAISTSLGCPFHCHYCSIFGLYGRPGIRYWSLETVFAWIDELVGRHGVRNLRLNDELFVYFPNRVEKFCDGIIERKYDLNIWAYGRVDTVPMPLLGKLKSAGFNWICLGIESGNEAVRRGVNKSIGREIPKIVRDLQAAGIHVMGNYMFGLPDDNLSTMEETLRLATELNCEFANFYTVMAYPGSRLYDRCAEKAGCLPPTWAGFSQHGYETQPLPTRFLSAREVLRFRDDAFHAYFSNPAYLYMLEQRFGPRVVSHVEQMNAVKLPRRLLEQA